MFYIFGGVLVTSYLIYKYRSSVSYNLLRAFSFVEEYIPKEKQAISKQSNGVYHLNFDNYTMELKTFDFNLPETLENSPIDTVYVSNGKIYNSILNIKNLDEETNSLKVGEIAAASISFENDNSNTQEIDITELVNDLVVDQFGLNFSNDSLPVVLILYNEFYDGNLLIEQFINNPVIFTIITTEGKIFSLNAMNFNITI